MFFVIRLKLIMIYFTKIKEECTDRWKEVSTSKGSC